MGTDHVVHINGREATAQELAPLAFAGYAHFTAAQVRDRGIRGLDLHLNRLRQASERMFGHALPDDRIRDHLRSALAVSPADVSLTATVYSRPGEFAAAGDTPVVDVLVRTGPPTSGPTGPLALTAVEYERPLAELKHVGEVSKTYEMRQAVRRGYDDAAFVDRHGRLSEATIWNLAFWDGDSVVWPEAAVLPGITMGILRRQLPAAGVDQRSAEITRADAAECAGAAVLNSWTPAVPVGSLEDITFAGSAELAEILHRAYREEPFVAP